MTATVFVSYRRGPAAGSAGRLYDAITARLGEDSVFMDVDDIEPGADFVEVISETLAGCRALVVVIDPDWLAAQDQYGRRRLDDPRDFVRLELEIALDNRVRSFRHSSTGPSCRDPTISPADQRGGRTERGPHQPA